MSSPKRAAKPAARRANGKRADKTAPRRQAVVLPAKPAANGASTDAKRLAAALERSIADGKLDLVSADALQALIAAACRVYSARTEAGEQFTPVPKHSISATDVMLTASGLLRAADLAVFELGMWQSWTGR
ncbi:MAG: hypothetical protein WAR76_06595 [Xanthobacteraceae bacterium]